ncbi:MAG: sigma-70 family RNA polymerase sigma factor [Acidimicrobiia bacterium]|nr:sigma-70 family RNA polymerase sigma factor [Acidimicrobiia bacterium]
MATGPVVDNSTDPQDRFDNLFEANYVAIFRYCVRRLGSADAEDAAADVFAVAWRRFHEIPAGEAGRAWLFAVAYRVIGNKYRTRRRQRSLSDRLKSDTAGLASHPLFESAPNQQVRCLYRALSGLGMADQELLRLWSWDGLTRSEIAHVLGINENAVDQRLHRARTRLRTRFDRLSDSSAQQEAEEAST